MTSRAHRRSVFTRGRPRQVSDGTAFVRILVGLLSAAMLISTVPPIRGVFEAFTNAVVVAVEVSRATEVNRVQLAGHAIRYGISYDLAVDIREAALEEGIDPELAFRLVEVESNFNERAVSPVGALGLTQLMPLTAGELQPGITREEIFDRRTNLRLGFRYLWRLLRAYDGSVAEALHAYNRGPGTVDRIRARGGDQANGYARKVLGSGPEAYGGVGFWSSPAPTVTGTIYSTE